MQRVLVFGITVGDLASVSVDTETSFKEGSAEIFFILIIPILKQLQIIIYDQIIIAYFYLSLFFK